MLEKRSQYINLAGKFGKNSDDAERKYFPETRTVYLSGKKRKLIGDFQHGIPVLESGRQQRTPILDMKRILKVILYGLGSGLLVTGVGLIFGKSQGD